MEWAALIIPTVAGLVLHYSFRKRVVWWEVALPMLPVFVIIPLVKILAETVVTSDYERHGGWCVEAVYVEDWNEYIHKTCTRTIDDGNGKSHEETYDCSYVEYYPPRWYLTDSNGYEVTITSDQFESLAVRFGNRRFVDMHRPYYTDDGDEYHTAWKGSDATFQPVTTEHRYENRVQASRGVLDFPTIDDHSALYDYPALSDVLGDRAVYGTAKGIADANQILQKFNAKFGREKQIRIWLLIFNDQPLQTAFNQESYWKGGNKNELVVCVGFQETGIPGITQGPWCHCFCWSPDGYSGNDELKIEIRNYIQAHGRHSAEDWAEFITSPKVIGKWKRKNFSEFSYLRVETPTWAVVVIYVLVITSTIGMCWRIMVNDLDSDNLVWTPRRYRMHRTPSR